MTESHARNTFDDDIEAPEADVLEQHASAGRRDVDESGEREQRSTPLEADDADAAEQGLDAEYDDEDEYRD